ncbi:hypothetical protein HB818_16330 [Listeria booriae]|uniref:hypothetical protein n=1 Tax=Listeria booriae TaxID=1552123 RepID=UPI00162A3246|nr:hypothetical protein [Listeria booriae]MBC1287326.1 hypothetical protein [Listeria booriae]MBC2069349.1 hypothetical protein [Listeria booriae]
MFPYYKVIGFVETQQGEIKEKIIKENVTKKTAKKLMLANSTNVNNERIQQGEVPYYIIVRDKHIEKRYANVNTKKETIRAVHYIKRISLLEILNIR